MRFTDKRETEAAEGGISYDRRTCCNGPGNFKSIVPFLTDRILWNADTQDDTEKKRDFSSR